jgi:hypothetical protein
MGIVVCVEWIALIACVEWLAFSHAMCLYFICCFQFFSKIQKSKNPKIQKSKNPKLQREVPFSILIKIDCKNNLNII